MAESLGSLKRTHYCGVLTEGDIGKRVCVMGWVQRRRDLGSLLFSLRKRCDISFDIINRNIIKFILTYSERETCEYIGFIIGKLFFYDARLRCLINYIFGESLCVTYASRYGCCNGVFIGLYYTDYFNFRTVVYERFDVFIIRTFIFPSFIGLIISVIVT